MEEKIENLQPLKIMELTELHRRQALLDEKFEAKECENERTADALIIAYFDKRFKTCTCNTYKTRNGTCKKNAWCNANNCQFSRCF